MGRTSQNGRYKTPWRVFAALIALLAASVLHAGRGRMSFPGIEKVISPDFLEKPLAGPGGRVGVIVLLEGYEDWIRDTRREGPDGLMIAQREIRRRQQAVIDRLDPGQVSVEIRFENLPGFSASVDRDGIRALAALREVASIEENLPLEEQLAQGLPLIEAMQVRSFYDGAGVAVAVIDTGINYDHERLGGGGFPNSKVIGGYDVFQDNPDPMDCRFHGTRVAGVVAGEEAAGPGDYIGGVAPAAKLYAIKATQGCSGGTNAAAIQRGIDWAVTHQYDDPTHPILVANLSLGGQYSRSSCDGNFPATAAAAGRAVAAGITVIAASGNSGFCDGMGHPACISDIISVGAVFDSNIGSLATCIDSRSCIGFSGCATTTGWACQHNTSAADVVTCYSNSASFLDLLAPANSTYTTNVDGGYVGFAGTSCASPYAAGAAAVIQSSARYRGAPWYTPAEVRSILITTGDPVTDAKNSITTPRINLGGFLATLEDCHDGVDNDGDTDADCDDTDCWIDTDGDTRSPCDPDCDDQDDQVWEPPAEVANVRWIDRWFLEWDDLATQAGPGTLYQVLRGEAIDLPVGTGAGEACMERQAAASLWLDLGGVRPGQVLYYLVRGANSCSPPSEPWGKDSTGSPRSSTACD